MSYELNEELDQDKVIYACEDDESHNAYITDEIVAIYDVENNELSNPSTSGSKFEPSEYIVTLPNDFNILRNAEIYNNGTKNANVIESVETFLSVFQRVLENNRNLIDYSTYLPPLQFAWLEDDSLLIEWIFKDFRIGFSFEPNPNESGWYLVSNNKLEESSKSGELRFEELELLLGNLLTFVLGYV